MRFSLWALSLVSSVSAWSETNLSVVTALNEVFTRISEERFQGLTCDVLIAGVEGKLDDVLLADDINFVYSVLTLDLENLENTFDLARQRHGISSKCTIFVWFVEDHVDEHRMTNVTNFVSRVPNSLLILFGAAQEVPVGLADRPSIRITEVSDRTLRLEAICRRQSLRRDEAVQDHLEVFVVDTWRPGQGFVAQEHGHGLFNRCPHHLTRRHLNVSYDLYSYNVLDENLGFEKLTGPDVELIRALGARFDFVPHFVNRPRSAMENGVYTKGGTFDVIVGYSEFAIGSRIVALARYRHVDITDFLYFRQYHWMTRNPIQMEAFASFTATFSLLGWIAILVTMSAFAIAFFVINWTYKTFIPEQQLTMADIPSADFFLLPFCKFVEPDPIPWFRKWSTGKLTVLLWSLFSMMIIHFFVSTLRTNLIAKTYEKPVDTNEDVLARDQKIYIPSFMGRFDHKRMQHFNMKMSDSLIAISEKADREKTRYRSPYPPWLPDGGYEEVQERGAVYVADPESFMYRFLINPEQGLGHFYTSKEWVDYYVFGFYVKKLAPWQGGVSSVLGWLRDMGLVHKYTRDPYPQEAYLRNLLRKETESTAQKLTVNHIVAPFKLLATGCVLGAGALIFLELNWSYLLRVTSWKELRRRWRKIFN